MDPLDAFLAERHNAVVAGVGRDGRPRMTPNWFFWDGDRFYVSTMRTRAKHRIFTRDPRAQVLIDDPAAARAVLVDATVEVWEDPERGLPYFRAVREKYGRAVGSDEELTANLVAEDRVLLVFTPEADRKDWHTVGIG